MSNFKDLIVAIEVPMDDGKSEIGTGLSISSDLILSARHVLFPDGRDAAKPIRIHWGAGHGTGDSDRECSDVSADCVPWKGEGDLDAVLISCPRPERLKETARIRFLRDRPGNSHEWESRGYPAAATPSGPLAPTDFEGSFFFPGRSDQYSEISVKNPPDSESGWRGASGMPIVCGGMLWGIANRVPYEFTGERLHVVPSWKLCADEGFSDLVPPVEIDGKAFRKSVCDKITGILENNSFVQDHLSRKYDVFQAHNGAQSVAAKIVDSPPDELLTKLYQIGHEPGLQIDRDGHKAILDLMFLALPALEDEAVRDAAEMVAEQKTSAIVSLGVSLQTVAEIAMARAEGKWAQFRMIAPDEPDVASDYALPILPEAGRDREGRQALRDFAQQLEGMLFESPGKFAEIFSDSLDKSFVKGSMSQRLELEKDRIDFIRQELRRRLANDGRSYYYAIIMPDDDAIGRAANNVLEKLKEKFPEIVFLALTSSSIIDETARYGNVKDILLQNAQEL